MQKVFQKTLSDTMHHHNVPVFIYKINYPCFTSTCSNSSARRVNHYYSNAARNTETYCRTVLYPQAVENTRYIQDNRPFNSYTLNVNYMITYNQGCFTSLYMDTYTYMGGAHGETKRTSDTWNFLTGRQLLLNDIYPLTPDSLAKLHKGIAVQIEERLIETPSSYFENYETLLRESFHPDNYYLIPDKFVIYYQQYDIAPYASGIPEFSFPLRLG